MNTLRADEHYLSYYQLAHDPFAARVPNFKFFPAQRKTILGQVHHLARHSPLMLIMTGPKDAGKTLLRQALIASINKDTVKIVNVSAQDCTQSADILALLTDELQATDNTVSTIIEQINKLTQKEVTLYLMIDDAELLQEDALGLLLNLANEQLKGLHIFLFARPSLLEQLESMALGKELTFNLPLTPYTLEETKEYLILRLEGAGQDLSVFTNEQILGIYTQSGGWPGVINQIAKDILLDNIGNQSESFSTDFDEEKEDVHTINLFDDKKTDSTQFFATEDDHPKKKVRSKIDLPKKHLLLAGIIAIVLVAIILFSRSSTTEKEPSVVADHYASLPETATQTTDIPLSVDNDTAQTVPVVAGQSQTTEDHPAVITNDLLHNTLNNNLPVEPSVSPSNTAATDSNASTPSSVSVTPIVKAPTKTQPTVDNKTAVVEQTKPQAAKKMTQENAWYRNQAGGQFTIQVSVASNEKAAQDFIKKESGDYRYFKRLRSGKTDYVITVGRFTNRATAQNEIKQLSKSIQDSKPWVRTFASIKPELAN